MLKPIKWSSLADKDLELLLEYLDENWNNKISLQFLLKLSNYLNTIQKNPKLFPFINENFEIRKCVVTKHNTLFYKETEKRIEILRLYDTRQNPETLKFS